MKPHSVSGIAFRLRTTDAIGWIPVLTIHGNQVVRTLLRVGVFAIGVFLLLLAASPVRATPFGPYGFTIFQTTFGDDSSYGVPAINDSGKIAVAVGLDAGGQQVRRYSGPNNSTIIADTTNFDDFAHLDVSINNNNDTVVFQGSISGARGLFASNGGLITTIVDDSGSFHVDGTEIHFVFDSHWDLGDNGEVVFEALDLSNRVGIFGRNLAAGGVFRRTTDADTSEFRLWSPAVNSQGDFAVLLSTTNGIQISRQQIISNFGTIMDTNGAFFGVKFEDSFPTGFGVPHTIDMNNAGTVAFRAALDNGDVGIFTSASGGPPITVVDTSGPFKDVNFPSINTSGTTAFLATFDVGGGKGLFRGPNSITDKIIAVGDVFTNNIGAIRTVTDIIGFGNDSHSKLGKVAFTIVDQFGEQYLVSGQPGLLIDIDLDNVLQLTTATDNTNVIMQEFTLLSFSPTELKFDYRILTPGATLIATINDIEVGRVSGLRLLEPMAAPATSVIPINPLALFGEFLPEHLVLKLALVGGPGKTIQLDNISLANIINGDFSTGDLTGWQFGGGNGAAMVTIGIDPTFVPEPMTTTLVLFGFGALGLARGRRRG